MLNSKGSYQSSRLAKPPRPATCCSSASNEPDADTQVKTMLCRETKSWLPCNTLLQALFQRAARDAGRSVSGFGWMLSGSVRCAWEMAARWTVFLAASSMKIGSEMS